MKTKIFVVAVLVLLLLIISHNTAAQLPKETEAQKVERMLWWTEARFGMFIHWGLYALPARHEWVKNRERLTNEEYQKYFEYLMDVELSKQKLLQRKVNVGSQEIVKKTPLKHENDSSLIDGKTLQKLKEDLKSLGYLDESY